MNPSREDEKDIETALSYLLYDVLSDVLSDAMDAMRQIASDNHAGPADFCEKAGKHVVGLAVAGRGK